MDFRNKWARRRWARFGDDLDTEAHDLAVRAKAFALAWAELMEARVEDGETVAECALECLQEAMAGCEDGGALRGTAGALLIQDWVYGTALREWCDEVAA